MILDTVRPISTPTRDPCERVTTENHLIITLELTMIGGTNEDAMRLSVYIYPNIPTIRFPPSLLPYFARCFIPFSRPFIHTQTHSLAHSLPILVLMLQVSVSRTSNDACTFNFRITLHLLLHNRIMIENE